MSWVRQANHSKKSAGSYRELPAFPRRPQLLSLPLTLCKVRAWSRPAIVALVLPKARPSLEALTLFLVIARLTIEPLLLLLLLVARLLRRVV